jgi:hypothetical protein
MFNIELTLEELSELHVTMFLRKTNLLEDIKHKDPKVAEISMRQLERVSPICYYIESVLREHHRKEAT